MRLADFRLKYPITPLTVFTGSTTMTIGTIKFPIYVVKFVVVDKPVIYNVILGTPWIHLMKVVTSKYH